MKRQATFVFSLLTLNSLDPRLALAAGNDDGLVLEEITITAQRREESAQRAAIAIDTLTSTAIEDANITKASDLTKLVPSLQIADSQGPYAVFFVRGVGNFAGSGLTDAALTVNFNGVPLTRSGSSGHYYDLERVEVLKGPQGTLYGRNATAGAINILSKQPVLGEFSGSGNLQYGNYSAVRADGAINLPLTSNSAMRAAVFYNKHDGYNTDGTDDQDDSGGRVSYRLEASDSLNMSVVADYFKQSGKPSVPTIVGVVVPPDFVQSGTPAPLFNINNRYSIFAPQTAEFLTGGNQNYPVGQTNAVNRRAFVAMPDFMATNNRYWGLSATLNWTTPVGVVTFIPAYRDSNNDFTGLGTGVQLREKSHEKQTSAELRLASNSDGDFKYVAGVFYMDSPNEVPRFYINQQSQLTMQQYKVTAKSSAAFASLTYSITSNLRATGGLRYTKDEKRFDANSYESWQYSCPAAPNPACTTAPVFDYARVDNSGLVNNASVGGTTLRSTIIPAYSVSDTYQRLTGKVGVDWDITDHNFAYVSMETGYKAGGFYFAVPGGTLANGKPDGVFDPESIRAYTLGLKNRFLDNRLQLNLEVFNWTYTNQQIAHLATDMATGRATIFRTENVGKSTIKGAELSLQYKASRNTLLGLNAQYNSNIYDNFTYTTPNRAPNVNANNGTGCPNKVPATPASTITGLPGLYTIDCSGKTAPMSPKWTLSSDWQQTFPLANDNKLVTSVRGRYQSEQLTGRDFVAAEYQSGYGLWDFDLTYSTLGEVYYVGAYVNNIFDKTAVTTSGVTAFSQFVVGSLNKPRTYGLRAGMKF